MKKNKLFTLALLSGILTMSSCDDVVDCGCDCNQPNITSWEILDAKKTKSEDGTVASGTAIIVYGSNLSDIVSITFKDKAAELQPAFMSDNQIVFQVPEGIAPDPDKNEFVAHIATKGCPTGFDAEILKVVISKPCVAMCDNEFAVKTLKVKGNSLFAPLEAQFMDANGQYTLIASTENGMINIDDQNSATITIPAGVKDGGNIVFKSNAGESITDFIFRDTRNMLITHDDDDYLNKFNGMKPDNSVTDPVTGITVGLRESKETIISKFFQSDNTNGNFSIFHRDGDDFVGLSYEPYSGDSNPDYDEPNYATPFGVFGQDILAGKANPNDYMIKFEVLVSKDAPMKGDALVIGFFNGVAGESWVDSRKFCSCWQPSKAVYNKDADGVWDNSKVTCDAWSCADWMTVAVPMEDLLYDFVSGNYRTNPQDGRLVTDGSTATPYEYFGDKQGGTSYFVKNTNYTDLFNAETPADLDDPSATAISIILDKWDSPEQDLTGRHPYIAVDNVRITPKNDNGGIWPLLQWGAPTRDFYTQPITSCRQ